MKSLRGKIISGFVLISLISVMIIVGLSYYQIYQVSTDYMRNDGIKLASQIKFDIELNGIDDIASVQSYIESTKQMNQDIKFIAFLNLDKKVLANTEKTSIGTSFKDTSVQSVISDGSTVGHIFKFEKIGRVYNVLIPLMEGRKVTKVLSIGVSLAHMNKLILGALTNILFASLLIIILAVIISRIISGNIVKPLNKFTKDFQILSKGDLTVDFKVNTKDEIAELGVVMNTTIGNIRNMILHVKENVKNIEKTSSSLASASDTYEEASVDSLNTVGHVSTQIITQGMDIVNIEEMINDFGVNLDIIYSKLDHVSQNSDGIKTSADNGMGKITKLTQSLKATQESFHTVISKVEHLVMSVESINGITNVINNVAKQTNLLALNSAIEAARAGEAGKGFAVVSDEIRKLANEVLLSSTSIEKLIKAVKLETIEVTDTSKLVLKDMAAQREEVDETVGSFSGIVDGVREIVPHIKDVEATLEKSVIEKNQLLLKIEEISTATKYVSKAIEEITTTIEQQTNSTKELKGVSGDLDKMSEQLTESIEKFNV